MDLFRSTANVAANQFQNPWNPANANGGEWGVDPNYLTPHYAAPFRPQYRGAQYNPYDPTFGQSFSGLINPFHNENHDQTSQLAGRYQDYGAGMAYRPMDTIVGGAQKFVIPAVAMYLAPKLDFNLNRANQTSKAMMTGWHTMWGKSATEAASLAARQGSLSFAADRVASGAVRWGARSLGAGAATAAGMGAYAGAAAGVVGGLVLPFMAAEAAVHVADHYVFDSYTSQRKMQNDLRDNFRNVFMGGNNTGNPARRGFSNASSAAMSYQLRRFSDYSSLVGSEEITGIADMAAKAGMLDDADVSKIGENIKSIANTVRVLQKVGNIVNQSRAVEILAAFKSAGVSTSSLESASRAIGNNSAIAGMSMDRFMDTIGGQARYMFQANGMMPYVGMKQASNVMAGFSTAKRYGLLSPGLLSMMGGVEGATQSTMSGMLAAQQTPYQSIMNYNRYMGGGASGGVLGNLSRFGTSVAGDPTQVAGAMLLHGNAMASYTMSKDGLKSLHDQVIEMARVSGQLDRNGTLSAEKAANLMVRSGMVPQQDIQAVIAALRNQMDAKTVGLNNDARASLVAENSLKLLNETGQNYGRFNDWSYATRRASRGVKGYFSREIGDINKRVGRISDQFSEFFSTMGTGIKPYTEVDQRYMTGVGGRELKRFGRILNDNAKYGDDKAAAVLNAGSLEEFKKLAREYGLSSGEFTEDDRNDTMSDEIMAQHYNEMTRKRSVAEELLFGGNKGKRRKYSDDWSGDPKETLNTLGQAVDKVFKGGSTRFSKQEQINFVALSNRVMADISEDGMYAEGTSSSSDIQELIGYYKKATGQTISREQLIHNLKGRKKGGGIGSMRLAVASNEAYRKGKVSDADATTNLTSAIKSTRSMPNITVADPEVRQSLISMYADEAMARKEASAMVEANQISFDSAESKIAATLLSGAANVFAQSVDKFSTVIQGMDGYTKQEESAAATNALAANMEYQARLAAMNGGASLATQQRNPKQ